MQFPERIFAVNDQQYQTACTNELLMKALGDRPLVCFVPKNSDKITCLISRPENEAEVNEIIEALKQYQILLRSP